MLETFGEGDKKVLIINFKGSLKKNYYLTIYFAPKTKKELDFF